MRKPLIDATNTVVNIIEIEDSANWQPPAGCTLMPPSDTATIGGSYDPATGLYSPPAGDDSHAR